jgi:hypothetical protein
VCNLIIQYLNTFMPKLYAFTANSQPMRCYGILNSDLDSGGSYAWTWARVNHIQREAHLNRCRYWFVVGSSLESEFVLRYTEIAFRVPEEDYV